MVPRSIKKSTLSRICNETIDGGGDHHQARSGAMLADRPRLGNGRFLIERKQGVSVSAVRVAQHRIVYNDFMSEITAIKEHSQIDHYDSAQLMSAFWDHFGSRGVGILGWCFVGMLSGADDAVVLRRELERRGLSKSALYNALEALREFGEKLEGRPLPRRDSTFALHLLKRLAQVSCL